MSRTSVLHFIYDDVQNPWVGGGGAQRLHEIYRRLAHELDVTVVTGSYPGAVDLVREGVRYERMGARAPYAWSRLSYGIAATRRLRTAQYDVTVFDFSAYTPLRVPRGARIGLFISQLVSPSARERWGALGGTAVGAWEVSQLQRARHVAAVSAQLIEEARSMLATDTVTRIISAGIDERWFEVQRQEREHLLFYGRFDVFQKGIDTLLDAMSLLVRDRPRLMLRLLGRGRERDRIEAMVRERGLADNVALTVDPAFEDVRSAMAGAQVIVLPSRFEGWGMIAAEAMAAGVPVVGTAPLAGVLQAPRGGRVVPVGDAAALAQAVDALLRDPAARAALSADARSVAAQYTWDRVAAQHRAFLEEIRRG